MVDFAFGATAMASIFAIVDPLGVVPFFSVLTEDLTPAQKQNIISKACLTTTITLGVFAVFGQWVYAAFGFTIPAFKIAGGIVLFGVAFEMLRGERSRTRLTAQEREETLERDEVAVVPLGIPLLAGPGAITTVMIYMAHPVNDPADKLFVFAGVLARIRPTPDEEARIEKLVREILDRLRSTLRSKGWEAKPFLAGSVAKGTHLTGTEIDVFVAFPPDLPRADLEERGLALGKILEKGTHRYAEHPYTRGWYGGFEVEIVPCYRITDATQRMSAVDRTPLHVDYVLGRVKEGQTDEIRLLKAWAEGIGVYGAEAKILGFSGYLCELLVLKYGTFRGVLEASLSWRPGIVLELDRAPGRTFPEPLTVVDPVDPNRNVASAVSVEQLATFVHAAREYLQGPSERFFFPRPLKPLSVAKLRAAAKRRGGGLLAISIPAPAVTDDVIYPQLRKAHRAFLDLFHRHEFHVFDSRFDLARKEAIFLFEFAVGSLPRVSRHVGPPVWVKNAKEFLDKWRGSPKTIAGPFVQGERWAVDVARDVTAASAGAKAKGREVSNGEGLGKTARRSSQIRPGASALRAGYAEAWTRLFDKRFPWER